MDGSMLVYLGKLKEMANVVILWWWVPNGIAGQNFIVFSLKLM